MRKQIYTTLILLLFYTSLFGQWPRFYWNQIELADSVGNIAVAGPDSNGVWSDSLRFWQNKLRIGVDTAATLADVRSLGFNESGTANTLPLWSTGTTLGDSWLSQSNNALSLTSGNLFRFNGHNTAGRPTSLAGHFGYNTDENALELYNSSEWAYLVRTKLSGGNFTSVTNGGYIPFGNSDGSGTLDQASGFYFQDDNGGRLIVGDQTYKNTNIGLNSGNALTTGSQNINIGDNAGAQMTTGSNNNNFGRQAGQFIKTGSNNNNYGLFAGFGGVNASYTDTNNFGSAAGSSLVTGFGSNHFGRSAASDATSSQYSNVFGYEAAKDATDLSIFHLNAFGYRAFVGASVVDDCIGIGHAVADSNSYQDIIVIGTYADAAADNEIVLGSYDRTAESGKQLVSDRLRTGNYIFNIDQDTSSLDAYVLTYNGSSNEIELQAASSGADGDGLFSGSNDGGTISTGFNAVLTDVLSFDNSGGSLLEIDGTNDNIEVFGDILSSTGASSPSLWTDTKMELTLGNDEAEDDFAAAQITAVTENTSNPSSQFIAAALSTNSRAEGSEFEWLVGINNRAEVINASNGRHIYGYRSYTGTELAGDVTRIWGQNNETRKSGSGAIGDMRGVYDLVNVNSNTGTITDLHGLYSEISRNTGTSGTISNLYGIRSVISHNSSGTLTNFYGMFLDHSSVAITPSGSAYSMLIDSDFKFRHTGYGDGNITGTAAYLLGVESDGDVIDKSLVEVGLFAGSGSLSSNTTITASSNDLTVSTLGDANTLDIDGATGNIGIQSAPGSEAELIVGGTNAVQISSGTTAQEPSTPANGMLRHDSTKKAVTGYADSGFQVMQQEDKLMESTATETIVIRKNTFIYVDMGSASQTITLDPTNLNSGSKVTVMVSNQNDCTLDSDTGSFISTTATTTTKALSEGAYSCVWNGTNWYFITLQ